MKLRTVLIVDDQETNRKILHKILAGTYVILEAENGQQALSILKAQSKEISAVLLDLVMPVLDGFAVLKAMKADPEFSKIPVITASQMEGDETELKALSLGAQDFVSKPYKADIIRHRLGNTIRLRETAALANRAEKDDLTGLLNKRFFIERVAERLHQDHKTKYDIICFDIERFKLANDTYGVSTGDKLLCYLGSLLNESPEALFSARFSADHFYQLVVRPKEDPSAKLDLLQEKMAGFPIEMLFKINCGVYRVEDIDTDVNAMCDRAQLAAELGRARADVKYVLYDDSIRQKLLEEQFVIAGMKPALEAHRFEVYYQPKYDLKQDRLAGAEALIRWKHPEKGMLSPGVFIPVLEKNGSITQLDRFVWEQACRDIHDWMEQGLPVVPISVNVSRADIFNPKLPEILRGLVESYQIPIEMLHLEITESAYTNDPQQIIAAAKTLHEIGFVIEMDDFGSGYSSLNMLAELPVDILKLDMKFVQNEATNASGKGIMRFVIDLAKWMKLHVTAEGVETKQQLDSLCAMGCDYVQGYYFSKPVPKASFETWLQKDSDFEKKRVQPAVPAQ